MPLHTEVTSVDLAAHDVQVGGNDGPKRDVVPASTAAAKSKGAVTEMRHLGRLCHIIIA